MHVLRSGLAARLSDLLDMLIPCGCPICRVAVPLDGPPLCGLCASRVVPIPLPLCARCGYTRVIPGPVPGECGECHSWPPELRRAASACLHAGPAAELVRGLKYRGWTRLADFMGPLMLPPALRLTNGRAPALVPVPLTPARLRERGFNQAELLARALSARTGWPVAPLLTRRRGGRALARLGRRDREEAVRSAFASRPPDSGTLGAAEGVLIVDDVITTGATGAACARALQRAGLSCLGIVSFARANPLPGAG